MGPIMQERTTAATKKGSKERVWTKVPGGNGSADSSKKVKANQTLRSQKKAGAQPKNVTQQLCSDLCPATEKNRKSRVKRDTPQATNASTTRHSVPKKGPGMDKGAECDVRAESRSSRKSDGSQRGQASRCQVLPLPLTALPDVHRELLPLEPLRLWEQEDVDGDSASDLSDSERFPVPPSPCSPPQLNLRAEVISHSGLLTHFPGPWNQRLGGYIYPDFLPPPFNTWSLQQLAVFLNTEGKGAPRPRPVGRLEKYLERLLQLEWLQVQTVQEENGRPLAPVSVARPRPQTAPPTSLSSPKCLRQCQRAFPLAFLSSLAEPSSGLLSGRACPHCRIRYPFCNGTCRLYAYQRHSRLSPLLERHVCSAVPPARSSSESRACGHSPTGVSSHLKRMQAAGNIRKPPGGGQRLAGGLHVTPPTGAVSYGPKSFTKVNGASQASATGTNPKRKAGQERERERTGHAGKGPRAGLTSIAADHSGSTGCPNMSFHEKLRHVQFVTK